MSVLNIIRVWALTYWRWCKGPSALWTKVLAWTGVAFAGLILLSLAGVGGEEAEPASGQSAVTTATATAAATLAPPDDPSPTPGVPTETALPTEAGTHATETATPEPSGPAPVSGSLEVYYFDVGQGDATLLKGPDFTILIDAGRHDRNEVVSHLESAGVTSIDLLIGTHPHADHIGQTPQVLQTFPVTEVWMSGATATSQTFERALDAIEASGAGYHEPRAGETQVLGSALLEVVSPATLPSDLNEGSIAVRVTYGSVVFLFTGDAEAGAEGGMLNRGHDLSAHILQLGHHGSRTSSTQPFLSAVQPEVAVYSAGAGNQYGHPHDEVLARLAAMGVEVYGTPEHGTVVVVTDGKTYEVRPQHVGEARAPPAQPEPTATEPPPPVVQAEPTPVPPQPVAPVGGCQPGQVDINSASFEELQAIIHVGPERAQQVLNLRPFASVDALTRVSGIAAARLADIKAQGVACVG